MIVMKFGGTSLRDAVAIRRALAIVRDRLDRRPLLVLSAIAGATDALLEIAGMMSSGRRQAAACLSAALLDRHRVLARNLLSPQRAREADERIRAAFDGVSSSGDMCEGHAQRLRDLVASQGELLSTALVHMAMADQGIESVLLDSRRLIRTDSRFTRAEICEIETGAALRSELRRVPAGTVPILQGFIAADDGGVTTTIGRGGSDLTASHAGAAIGAQEIQIWTDVSGILTADPKIVPQALRIAALSYRQASNLARFGAKVLHPQTLQPAMWGNIPVRVCGCGQPRLPGTCITRDIRRDPAVKSIACRSDLAIVEASARAACLAGIEERLRLWEGQHRFIAKLGSSASSSKRWLLEQELARELEGRFGYLKVSGMTGAVCVVGMPSGDRDRLAEWVSNASTPSRTEPFEWQGEAACTTTPEALSSVVQAVHGLLFSQTNPSFLVERELGMRAF